MATDKDTHIKLSLWLHGDVVEALDRIAAYHGSSRAEALAHVITLADQEARRLKSKHRRT